MRNSKGVDTSNLLRPLPNGLHNNIAVLRRGSDLALFQFYHGCIYYRDIVAVAGRCVCRPSDYTRAPVIYLVL